MIPRSVWQQHDSSVANYLNRLRVSRLFELSKSCVNDEKCRVLDVGCGRGGLSRLLSETCSCDVVGVDIQKNLLGLGGNGKLDFLLGDINSLPFSEGSFDVIICVSILEHLLDLNRVLVKLKRLLKVNGTLIVGYPLETRLFRLILRIISPHEYMFIDQSQTLFMNPYTHKLEDYWKNPTTHKQNYLGIRKTLMKYFNVVFQVKVPFAGLPDLLSFYECVRLN
jgi:2-polyprenyl-3-methyl-5-hydroxy-6-metoxy-1,4-benzoquinol methylase